MRQRPALRQVACSRNYADGIWGPFRQRPLESFASITPDEACKHPTWSDGAQDFGGLGNADEQGPEVIEASLLFDRPASDVHVLIHPTSTVHALVEFVTDRFWPTSGRPTCRCRLRMPCAGGIQSRHAD